jgi:hypothetical protein
MIFQFTSTRAHRLAMARKRDTSIDRAAVFDLMHLTCKKQGGPPRQTFGEAPRGSGNRQPKRLTTNFILGPSAGAFKERTNG